MKGYQLLIGFGVGAAVCALHLISLALIPICVLSIFYTTRAGLKATQLPPSLPQWMEREATPDQEIYSLQETGLSVDQLRYNYHECERLLANTPQLGTITRPSGEKVRAKARRRDLWRMLDMTLVQLADVLNHQPALACTATKIEEGTVVPVESKELCPGDNLSIFIWRGTTQIKVYEVACKKHPDIIIPT